MWGRWRFSVSLGPGADRTQSLPQGEEEPLQVLSFHFWGETRWTQGLVVVMEDLKQNKTKSHLFTLINCASHKQQVISLSSASSYQEVNPLKVVEDSALKVTGQAKKGP